jgi:GTP diphosphokinase / guanosine-3',5'-bis(diphosphate) 3'-diphosphatase
VNPDAMESDKATQEESIGSIGQLNTLDKDEFQLFDELLGILKQQERPESDLKLAQEVFEYARQKHDGQLRADGGNYITHPVEVAMILAQVPVDTATVCAAMLHDVLEDTQGTADEIKTKFGTDILHIVQGVTKLGKYEFQSKQERHAENFRKMFLAMADDVRVILLKLCDRLHNMRTLGSLKPEKQERIARETLEVFAPLANRMGMGRWRAELEDLSFQYTNPDDYKAIVERIEHEKADWEATMNEMIATIREELSDRGITVDLFGRIKHYYSLWGKMKQKNKALHDIYDLTALRIIVSDEKECYEVLGIIHSLYKPIPGRFKDYVAMAKSNLYQSLHTTVLGINGRPIEVQIRTQDMHRVAEYGVAAHWRYKEAKTSVSAASSNEMKMSWLKQMMDMKEHAEDAQDYVDSVKLDLFSDEVFVFSPGGDVIDLPTGSTPIDFAFRIHTEVGNTCTGSMVNGKIVPLDYHLSNGDVVEIMTSKKATPKLDWIKFVKTHQARTRIRQWFKKNMREDHIQQGRALLEAELNKQHYDEMVKSGKLEHLANELNYPEIDDMLMALGYGELSIAKILNRVEKEKKPEPETQELINRLAKSPFQKRRNNAKDDIEGLEGMLYHLAKCCSPLPGDDIIGVITRSRGVMVHRSDCANMMHINPQRTMTIRWRVRESGEQQQSRNQYHNIRLEVLVIDRIGVFKDVLARVSDSNTNLTNARVKTVQQNMAMIELAIDVGNIDHLNRVINAISKLSDVISVRRSQFRTQRKDNTQDT